ISLPFVMISQLFLFSYYLLCLSLPSFPTRRSSDLLHLWSVRFPDLSHASLPHPQRSLPSMQDTVRPANFCCSPPSGRKETLRIRSEEHTSELQSRFDLVCSLLL